MMDTEFALGERLLLGAVVKNTADLTVECRPDRQARERLVVKTRDQQRLVRDSADDVCGETEKIGAGDDGVELPLPSTQRVEQRGRVNAAIEIAALEVRRDTSVYFGDRPKRLAVREWIVCVDR